MLPITIAIIGGGAKASTRIQGFFIGGLYGLGMSISYGTLGIVVVLTGSKFGTLNASPWFNISIAVIFIILALAMFNIIQIDLTRYRSGVKQGGTGKRQHFIIFTMGIIAALLAGACVAPVVISVILYSATLYGSGQPAGLLLPFLLGAGMAIPWPFAGAGLSFLPRPGKWMVWVKYIFGIIITVIAIHYGITGIKLLRQAQEVYKLKNVISEKHTNFNWIYSISEGLRIAKRKNKPILIDFWASWCKNCLVMDATTFRDHKTQEKLKSYVLVKYKAEKPNEQATREVLDYFGIIGLPAYVILTPK